MPLVTLTLSDAQPATFKTAVLAGVHAALVASGVPPTDRFQRVLALAPEDFRFDPAYPDVARPRGEDFVLIEILLSVGRSVKVKRQILADIIANLRADPGLDPEHVFVVFKETQWENWAFAGGRQIHG